MWDRNKTLTSATNFAYPMALSNPLPCTLYTNMLTRTLYTLTGPVKPSEDSVSYLNTHFSKYPPHWAHLRARVIEVFRKFVLLRYYPRVNNQLWLNRKIGHNSRVVVGMAPSLPSHQGLSTQCVQPCFLMLIVMLTHMLGMMWCLLMWVWTYCRSLITFDKLVTMLCSRRNVPWLGCQFSGSALIITNLSGNEPRLILF